MEQVNIIEDSHLPAAQVVTIVLPSIPHDDSSALQATPGTYESSQQETVSLDSHELPLAATTIQLTQVQSAVPLEVLKEDSQAPDTVDNQNLVVVGVHHHEAVGLAHQPHSPSAATLHQDTYHHHHHHNHHLQQHHHHHNNNNNDDDDPDEEDNHHHFDQKPGAGAGASSKSRTRFKWTKESAQVALNLVKHGCKPVLVSVAVGCSLRTAQKFVEIVKPKMEGDAFKDYEIKRRGRKSRDVNQRLEAIREVLSKDVSKTQVQIAADLKVSNTTVCRDIKRIGASWKRNEGSSSVTGATTDDQTTSSKAEPNSKRQPPTASNNRSGRSNSQRQRRNTPNIIAANNNDNQTDSVNITNTAAAAAVATTTSNSNNASSTTATTSTITTNVAPKHELAQQVHA